MVFNSLAFIVFAAIFFPAYFVARGNVRLILVLAASYFFYGWWDWRFIGLIMLSTLVDYAIGRRLGIEQEGRRRKALLTISLVLNLGLLGLFKYFDFFSDSLAASAGTLGIHLSWTTLNLVLPVGISFYTFQTLSYTIDVYRGKIPPEKSLLRFACYVSLFPQLVAGPIVRASQLLPQMYEDARFEWGRTLRGLELVAWGLFLKIVLADTLGNQIAVDGWFSEPTSFGLVGHLFGVLFFSFQIYGDFAGYSLIAIGLGRIMGWNFGVNFNRPYFAASFSDFWERWHISLSSWIRDYLYIPLGGNRHSTAKTVRNLVVTMFLGGLWHGAAWNYIIWGLLHGAYLVLWQVGANTVQLPQVLRGGWMARVLRLSLIVLVFFLTAMAWVFFRAETVADALIILGRIVMLDQSVAHVTTYRIGLIKGLALIATVLAIDLVCENERLRIRYLESRWLRAGSMLMVLWMIAGLGTFSGSNFIYFQF